MAVARAAHGCRLRPTCWWLSVAVLLLGGRTDCTGLRLSMWRRLPCRSSPSVLSACSRRGRWAPSAGGSRRLDSRRTRPQPGPLRRRGPVPEWPSGPGPTRVAAWPGWATVSIACAGRIAWVHGGAVGFAVRGLRL